MRVLTCWDFSKFPNRFQDGRAIFRRKSGGALCVSRRVVGRKPVQAKSARFVPTDCPSVKKIRAANDERTAQAKSARLVPKDCPSVKRETKLFWRLGLDRISYGRHASCVLVYGSQPTHSRVRQDICRRATDASVKVGFQHDMAGYCSNSSHVQVLGSRPTHSHD